MPIKSVTSTCPDDVMPGDVFIVTVVFHVRYDGSIKAYRCPYPNAEVDEEGIPQGDEVPDTLALARSLVPVLIW